MIANDLSATKGNNEFSDYYETYKETQLEILESEKKKTRNKIFYVAALLFAGDLFAILMANILTPITFVYILFVPLLIFGVAFIANVNPLLAIILASLIFVNIIAINVYLTGAASIVSGLFVKAGVVFFLLSGLSNAREAATAKKALQSL